MNGIIKKSILDGRLILFLGAGASIGSSNKQGESPPLSNALAELIAKRVGWNYRNESLSITYSAAKNAAGIEVEKLFTEQYQYCSPSHEYLTLSKYPWARIYTTNIDDALELALQENSNQDVSIKNRKDRVEDKDQLFKRLDYVYLNGSIRNKEQGFVFSPEEYGKSNADMPLWYEEMAVDFFQCNFLFIGTKLDEPIFYHQIERYRQKVSTGAPQSYVLTPNATDIEVASLSSYGLTHIPASLSDFIKWLTTSILEPPTPTDIATSKIPVLRSLIGIKSEADKEKYAEIFQYITLVSTEILSKKFGETEIGTIRSFYKGYKPTWKDILDDVPAKTIQYNSFFNVVDNAHTYEKKAVVLVGPAGSGKSTYLKMAALQLSLNGTKVYFIEQELRSLKEVIYELEKTNKEHFYLFFDRLDPYKSELHELFASKTLNKGIVVACEGKNIWHNRVASHLSDHFHTAIKLEEIDKEDVQVILDKLRQHGPWTRLSGMSKSKQFKELFEKSRRQLLIGLIETTTGMGFEKIIERDFQSIVSEDDQAFFLMICLCTIHRAKVSPEIISRSLSNIYIFENPAAIADRLSGNVSKTGGSFIARHPVYARRVLESIVNFKLVQKCICALLDSFAVYPHPVIANIEKSQGTLFKHLFNHRFLKDILRDNRESILSIYSRYEKIYENDGLFWLQYGLATRSFGDQKKAYEQLLTAYHAYPHDHTAHALAQQELILSMDNTLSKPNALRYLDQAVDRLKDLDKTLRSDDTYPIVTMTEGHVKCLMHIEGQSIARVKAKEYTGILSQRMMKVSHERLKEAHDRLFMFASTGTWNEET